MWRRSLILMVLALSPSAASARILWRSGHSISAWDEKQSAAPPGQCFSGNRIAIASSPVPGESQKVLKLTLHAGDIWYNARHSPPIPLGNRTEVVHDPHLGEGDERWYHWRVFFPEDFAVTDGRGGGAVFTQWHHWSPSGEPGSPPLLLVADANRIRVVRVPELNSQDAITLVTIPQKKGRWRDFVMHVVFSSKPDRGLVELWCDKESVLSKHVPTLFPGYENYLKMGLYRRPTARENNTIYIDDVVEATSRSDVWPKATQGRRR